MTIEIIVRDEKFGILIRRETICSNPPTGGDWANVEEDIGKLQRYLNNK